jgi:hypothetical protein
MYLKGETSYFSSLNHGTMINSYKNPQYLADENLAESSSKASASAAPDQGHLLVGSLEARQGGTSGQRLDDWMIWGTQMTLETHGQWIGLGEILQENPIFNGKIYGFL